MASFDKALRRVVPSVARLSHNPAFKAFVDVCDLPPRLWFREFRQLPPNHLRTRLGVRNRIFANQVEYLTPRAANFWLAMALEGMWSVDSTILEIGCGCGRAAQFLRDFKDYDRRFNGHYYGIDVDPEMLAWCRDHFDRERFTFMRSSHNNKVYVNDASAGAAYRIDLPDESVDFAYSHSLFSHLLEPELRNYMEEAYRLLRPGRAMNMTVFCVDYPPPTYGTRHTFRHRIDNAMVESLAMPEAAVAYREDFLVGMARDIGFSRTEVRHSPDTWQPALICWK
jgi:SAM-dependent methyltransferase